MRQYKLIHPPELGDKIRWLKYDSAEDKWIQAVGIVSAVNKDRIEVGLDFTRAQYETTPYRLSMEKRLHNRWVSIWSPTPKGICHA